MEGVAGYGGFLSFWLVILLQSHAEFVIEVEGKD